MKKKMYALSGIFMIILVISGLWASNAGGFTDSQETIEQAPTSLNPGVSIEGMTRAADLIVIGSCTGTSTQWVDGGRHVVTLATVSVAQTLKGAAPESVTLAIPGGRASRGKFQLAMTYPDAPTIAPNEKVALFLVSANEVPNTYAVMSNAGKFSIVEDVDGKQVVTSVPMKVRAPRATGLTSGNTSVIGLSEFTALVESYLR
jgi:hypothetical protein